LAVKDFLQGRHMLLTDSVRRSRARACLFPIFVPFVAVVVYHEARYSDSSIEMRSNADHQSV
jgi:hypothetical protein